VRSKVVSFRSFSLSILSSIDTDISWLTTTDVQGLAQASEETIKQVRTEQDQHMKEVLDCLEKTEAQVVTLNSALVEKDARVDELEHLLNQRMEDMDEADEKLIEVKLLESLSSCFRSLFDGLLNPSHFALDPHPTTS